MPNQGEIFLSRLGFLGGQRCRDVPAWYDNNLYRVSIAKKLCTDLYCELYGGQEMVRCYRKKISGSRRDRIRSVVVQHPPLVYLWSLASPTMKATVRMGPENQVS